MKALVDAATPRRHHRRQDLGLARREVLGVTLEENLRMIADSVAFLRGRGREVIYDAEHFFDGFKRNPDYALADAARPPPTPARRWIVLCDTNGGTLPERGRRRPSPRSRQAAGVADRHPHATTTATWPSPTPWPPSRAGADAGAGDDQRHRRALRQRRPRQRHRQPRAQDWATRCSRPGSWRSLTEVVALRLRDGQHELPPRPAVRRPQRLRPQGRHARRTACRRTPASYEHIDPDGRRQRARESWSASCPGKRTSCAKLAEIRPRARRRAADARSSTGCRTWRTRATSSRRPRRRSTCWCGSARRLQADVPARAYRVNVESAPTAGR